MVRAGEGGPKTSATTSAAMRSAFEGIFAGYARAREERFGKEHPLWARLEALAATLRVAPVVAGSRDIIPRWSAGRGRWASVPWFALLNRRETTKPSQGVYVVYLLRADMSGAYLSLSQGASWFMVGAGRGELRRRASRLRQRCGGLLAHGFEVGTGIDLRSRAPLASGYEDSTIAFKLYERGAVPDDDAMQTDLTHVLKAYDALVPSSRFLE